MNDALDLFVVWRGRCQTWNWVTGSPCDPVPCLVDSARCLLGLLASACVLVFEVLLNSELLCCSLAVVFNSSVLKFWISTFQMKMLNLQSTCRS